MDRKAGALNDSGFDEYAQIEKASGLTNSKQGHSMLHHRHKMTDARNISNQMVKYTFNINHVKDPAILKEFGDYV